MVSFNGDDFYFDELEAIIDETEKIYDELDEVYWKNLEHLYAGMAMHAILTHYRNAKLPAEYCSDEAEYYAKGLVKKYKKEANNG